MATIVSRVSKLSGSSSYIVETRKDGVLQAVPSTQTTIALAFDEVKSEQNTALGGVLVVQEATVTTTAV